MMDELTKRLWTLSQNYAVGKANKVNYETIMDAIKEITRLTSENRDLSVKLSALSEAGTGYSQQTVDALTKERDELRLQTDRLANDRSLGTRDVVLDYEKLASDVEAERSRVDIERKHAAYCQAQFDALDREFTELRMVMENFHKTIKQEGTAQDDHPGEDGSHVIDQDVDEWRKALVKTEQERDAALRDVESLKKRTAQLQKGVEQLREDYRRAAIYDHIGVIVDQDEYDDLVKQLVKARFDIQNWIRKQDGSPLSQAEYDALVMENAELAKQVRAGAVEDPAPEASQAASVDETPRQPEKASADCDAEVSADIVELTDAKRMACGGCGGDRFRIFRAAKSRDFLVQCVGCGSTSRVTISKPRWSIEWFGDSEGLLTEAIK